MGMDIDSVLAVFRKTSSGCASCLAGRGSVMRSTQNGSGIGQKLVPLLEQGRHTGVRRHSKHTHTHAV